MRNIQDLYSGKMEPPKCSTGSDTEYNRILEQLEEFDKQLGEQLAAEDMKLHNYIMDLQTKLSAIAASECYIQGFRDGGGIMLDVLTGKNETLI